MPYFDPSRPIPDSVTPPKGPTSFEMMPAFPMALGAALLAAGTVLVVRSREAYGVGHSDSDEAVAAG